MLSHSRIGSRQHAALAVCGDSFAAMNPETKEIGMVTILALEDNPNDLLLLRQALARCGVDHEIVPAADGVEAQHFLQELRAAPETKRQILVFSDLNMPRRNGLEFIRWLKGHEHFRHIPVVMISSFDDEAQVDDAFEFGAIACLRKPAGARALGGLVRTLVELTLPAGTAHPARART
jgi:CheY-like chemotaxis protein